RSTCNIMHIGRSRIHGAGNTPQGAAAGVARRVSRLPWRNGEMRKLLFGLCAAVAVASGPAMAQNPVKIGFINTFSGPTAVIGNDMRDAFELALDHLGRKMGGLPVEVIYEDDQQKPEVGKQKTEKVLQS